MFSDSGRLGNKSEFLSFRPASKLLQLAVQRGRAMPGSYKQLNVWKKSIDLADDFYTATDSFPRDELFGIVSQMRRAAVSIASNIAEGQAHHSHRDFIRYLRQSRGSLAELQTQLIIAVRRRYLTREQGSQLFRQADEVDKMLSGLIASQQAQMEGDDG